MEAQDSWHGVLGCRRACVEVFWQRQVPPALLSPFQVTAQLLSSRSLSLTLAPSPACSSGDPDSAPGCSCLCCCAAARPSEPSTLPLGFSVGSRSCPCPRLDCALRHVSLSCSHSKTQTPSQVWVLPKYEMGHPFWGQSESLPSVRATESLDPAHGMTCSLSSCLISWEVSEKEQLPAGCWPAHKNQGRCSILSVSVL